MLILSLMAFVGISVIYVSVGSTVVVLAAASYLIVIGGIVILVLAKDYDRRLKTMARKTSNNQAC